MTLGIPLSNSHSLRERAGVRATQEKLLRAAGIIGAYGISGDHKVIRIEQGRKSEPKDREARTWLTS